MKKKISQKLNLTLLLKKVSENIMFIETTRLISPVVKLEYVSFINLN